VKLLTVAYKCDFCYRVFGRPVDAHNHEQGCRHGPHRRHCRTCVHGISAIIMWTGWPDADQPIYGPWCDFHDKDMGEKPYNINCEEDVDDYKQIYCVPGTCEHYQYKGYSGWTKEEQI